MVTLTFKLKKSLQINSLQLILCQGQTVNKAMMIKVGKTPTKPDRHPS